MKLADLKHMNWQQLLFPARPSLPQDLTATDWLKTLAVLLMVIDHIGFWLLPDIEWFRVIGRLSAPIWFFLIGYARTREIPDRWIAGGFILTISNPMIGLDVWPLTILFTMMLVRWGLNPFWRFVTARPVYFWWCILLLVFFGPVTDMVVEYGTFGFLLALGGFAMRRRARIARRMTPRLPEMILASGLVAFCLFSMMKFGFDLYGNMVLAAGMLGLFFVLLEYRPMVYAGTASHIQAPLIRFCGRYSLEIYVIHLLIFKAVYGLQRLSDWLLQ